VNARQQGGNEHAPRPVFTPRVRRGCCTPSQLTRGVRGDVKLRSRSGPSSGARRAAPPRRHATNGAAQDTPPEAPGSTLSELAWISGTWAATTEEGVTTEEHWRPLQGTTILGSSHTFDAKKTVFYEHLRITAMRGTIAYLAMPGGAAPTFFLLARNGTGPEGALTGSFVEFENAKNDAPQRIRYERTEGGITATISQMDGSRAQSWVLSAGE
jgi:Domain of unknown function (DUF6265)